MDSNRVTIVMYHYVRDLKNSRYPSIKGLDVKLFKEQVSYLNKNYHFVTAEEVIDAIENDKVLPPKSVMLTFDDGYADHFDYVFPFLDKLGIQGLFFPPAGAILDHSLLDVNKIHFILAAEDDKSKIIKEIKNQLDLYREEYNLESFSHYYDKLATANRFDTGDVIFIKRLLQRELDESLRGKMSKSLFEKIVDVEEEQFCRELYMDVEQIECMSRHGMHFGSHGYKHTWLGSLSDQEQITEIEESLSFLKKIGADPEKYTMCYPYGNYNDTTVELMDRYDFKFALTTQVDVADLTTSHRYKLARLDTNDIPKDRVAPVDSWYQRA